MDKPSKSIAILSGLVYFVQGALGIAAVALPLYLRRLGWSVSEITTISSLVAFPWVLKILYGLLSDMVPLFGYRRKSYLWISAIMAALGWLGMILLPGEKMWIILTLTFSNLGFAATDVITDGLIVENSTPKSSPIYQSIAWGSRSAGALVSGFLGGWLVSQWSPKLTFAIAMALPLIVTVAVFWIQEEKQTERRYRNVMTPIKQCFSLLMKGPLKFFSGVLILVGLPACFGVPLFFHMKETLKFSETYLGFLMSLGWAGAIVGSLFYAKVLHRVSPKKILSWAIWLNALNILSAFLILDNRSAFVILFIGGILGCLIILPIMSSAALLTHKTGVEGTLFAVLMSIFNIGQIGFGFVGGKLFPLVGLQALILGSAVCALLGLFFVAKLPFDPTGQHQVVGENS